MKYLGFLLRGFIIINILFFLIVSPAKAGYLTIAVDGTNSNSVTNGNTFSVNKPANTDNGDLMIAIGTIEDNVRQITAPNDWTRLSYRDLATRALGQHIWYKIANNEGASYTFTTSDNANDEYAVSIVTYSGVDQFDPIGDWKTQWNNAVANCTIPSMTISNTANKAVSLCSSAYGATWTAPAGTPAYSEQLDYRANTTANNVSHEIADATYAATGATGTQTATPSTTDYNIGSHLELKAATDYSYEQEGYRFREDNGSETTATWLKNQDTNITREAGFNTRLRLLLNATNDPDSLSYGISYKKTTDSVWKSVGTSTGSITYGTAGAATATATAVSQIPYPASIAAGDLLIFCTAHKLSTTTINMPYGWTALSNNQATGGSGADGVDSGNVTTTVYTRIADGTEKDTNLDLTFSGAPSIQVTRIFRYTKATGKTWSLAASQGTDTTAGTAWSVTGNVDPGFTAGDMAIIASGVNSNTPTWSLEAISASGVTFGAMTERQDSGSATGNRVRLVMAEIPVSSGTSTGVPTYTMTGSSTAGSYPAGASIILRARQVDDPIQLGASPNIAASGVNTTYQLTAPSGKTSSNFTTGQMQDDLNPANAVNIASGNYTEMEWSLIATSQAATNDIYQFRITKNGVMINTYTVDPRWTIGIEANTQYKINKLEQQINLIDQEYSTTGSNQPADNSLGLIQWDSSKYTGAIVYFEAVIYCSACTGGNTAAKADLYTKAGSAVTNASATSTATAYTRIRAPAAITGDLSDGTEYTVRLTRDATGGTAYIQSARLIITQIDDTTITKTQNQIELGNNTSTAATSYGLMTGIKIFKFDTQYFNPYNEIYFEATLTGSGAGVTAYAALSTSASCASTVTNSEVSVTGTSWSRVRSSAIQVNMVDDSEYWVCLKTTSGTGYIANAKLIINQSQTIGLQSVQLVHEYINTPKTNNTASYISQNFLNQYKQSNIAADQVTAFLETTMMTSAGTAYARLYNATDASALGSTEITTNGTSYSRVRITSDIKSSLPASAKDLDTQIKNSATNTTTVSTSWLILNVESLIDNKLNFTISGVNSGTTTNGIVTSVNSTYNTLPFGAIMPFIPKYVAHQLFTSTNAANGYYVTIKLTNYLQGLVPANNIDPFSGTWASPTVWATPTGTTPNDNTGWIGANTSDTRIPAWTTGSGKFGGIVYNNNQIVMYSQSADEGTNIYVTYGIEVNTYQPVDSYSGTILYSVLPTY